MSIVAFPSYSKPSKDQTLCQSKLYTCMRVKRGQTWEKLFPDDDERDIVRRVNHTNQHLYPGKVILVPNNLAEGSLLDYSPLPLNIPSTGEKLIIVDLEDNKNAWGAYDEDGSLVRWGPASGGSNYCRDLGRRCHTKAGQFRIYSLGDEGCKSTKFPLGRGGAPMPYCMYFNGGQALHGSPGEVVRGNISHGCVRLFVDDAEWLRFNFVEEPDSENNYRGTRVIVKQY
jgi:L,D-transpeptidase ErfK/SrfK